MCRRHNEPIYFLPLFVFGHVENSKVLEQMIDQSYFAARKFLILRDNLALIRTDTGSRCGR